MSLLSRQAVGLAIIVGVAQMVLPEQIKPATVIGGLYGAVEKNEIKAKQDTVVEFTRRQKEAEARPPAIAQEDVQTNQKQIDAVEKGMETEQTVANGADWACVAGSLISPDSKDWGNFGRFLRGGCGLGAAVRASMANELAQTSRNHSALIQAGDEQPQ